MFEIKFYIDGQGREPVKEYLKTLDGKAKTDKNARIQLKKIRDYIGFLSEDGTMIGEPHCKHVEGELWELRPLDNRIFFFCWNGDHYILLHYFKKKTQKTPRREIEKAKNNMKDFLERMMENEKK